MSTQQVKQLLRQALAALGYRVQGTRYCPRQLLDPSCLRVIEFDDLICRRMFESGPELTFIQIGAFDGVTRDPLRKYIDKCGWRGAVVEPQAKAADHLRELYRGNDRVSILQAALDRECGSRTLYTVEAQTAPAWAGGLASFQRDTILKHAELVPGLTEMIREETVDSISQIDAEGSDGYLLSLFPFDRVVPVIVHWEVKHMTKSERENCLDRLIAFGYRVASSGAEDMLAVLDEMKGVCGPDSPAAAIIG